MATTLFLNANILCLDPSARRAQALAIDGGRILAVGDLSSVERLAGPVAQRVDLAGRTVMPGLIDIHTHHIFGGRGILYELQLSPLGTFEELLAKVRNAAETMPEGRWIQGGMWGGSLREQIDCAAGLAALDEASLGRPVVLIDDTFHCRWCNSAAMAVAGIDASSPDPVAGRICRDAVNGLPTGVLVEAATGLIDLIREEANYGDIEMDARACRHSVSIFNSFGVTAFQDAYTPLKHMQLLADLDRRGDLNAWVLPCMPAHPAMAVPGPIGVELFKHKDSCTSEHVRPAFAKFFIDGVPNSHTSAMLEPYRESKQFGCCYRGATTMNLPQLARLLADCETHGIAAKMHCAGDASLRMAVDAMEVLREFNGPTALPHQIAHTLFVDPAEVPRMAALNLMADISPYMWYPNDMERVWRLTLEDKVVDRMLPVRDLVEAGITIAAGSDWPLSGNPNPWAAIEGLVTRRDPTGALSGALDAEQAIDVQTALAAFTRGSAKAMGMDQHIGTLEAGKSADFIIVDQDMTVCAPTDIAKTQVLETWFAGRRVYQR